MNPQADVTIFHVHDVITSSHHLDQSLVAQWSTIVQVPVHACLIAL